MDLNRQKVMDKARAKRLRRASARKARTSKTVPLTDRVKGLTEAAAGNMGLLITASANTLKHAFVG